MKLKTSFNSENICGTNVIVPVDNTVLNGFIRANNTATYIVKSLEYDTTEEDLVNKVVQKYGVKEDVACHGVKKTLAFLRANNLLQE